MAIVLLVLGVFGYVYVRSILNNDGVEVQQRSDDRKKADEEKPAKVTLVVRTSAGDITYVKDMQNTNSVSDLLKQVKDSEEFTYEKIAYSYGTKIDSVNGATAPEGYDWKVLMTAEKDKIESLKKALNLSPEEIEILDRVAENKRVDITYMIDDIPLVDKALFDLELAKSEDTRQVRLFYYKATVSDECSLENIQPVQRQLPVNEDQADNKELLLERTITLLIQNDITESERSQGFTTEFPETGFRLLDIEVQENKAILTFSEVYGFTTGGACRVMLLSEQIVRTAKQFYDDVELRPEGLFQP